MQVGFVEVAAAAGRLEIDAADLDIDGVFLRSHEQVRAIAAQFAVDLVPDIGGHGNHRSRHRDAEGNGNPGEQLAPPLATERLIEYAGKHGVSA